MKGDKGKKDMDELSVDELQQLMNKKVHELQLINEAIMLKAGNHTTKTSSKKTKSKSSSTSKELPHAKPHKEPKQSKPSNSDEDQKKRRSIVLKLNDLKKFHDSFVKRKGDLEKIKQETHMKTKADRLHALYTLAQYSKAELTDLAYGKRSHADDETPKKKPKLTNKKEKVSSDEEEEEEEEKEMEKKKEATKPESESESSEASESDDEVTVNTKRHPTPVTPKPTEAPARKLGAAAKTPARTPVAAKTPATPHTPFTIKTTPSTKTPVPTEKTPAPTAESSGSDSD